MGCDYSTDLKDIVVKEGRLFKFCKIKVNFFSNDLGQRKKMDLVETEVGSSKTVVMVWEKYLDEGKGDVLFTRRFFSEVSAIIIDIDVTRELSDSTIQTINAEIASVRNSMGTLQPPVYVFSRISKSLGQETQKSGLVAIDSMCSFHNWKQFYIEENHQERERIKSVATDLYLRGIMPRRMNSGTHSLFKTPPRCTTTRTPYTTGNSK